MTRRDFGTAIALSAPAMMAGPDPPFAPSLVKPSMLRPGDTVGLITPSSNLDDMTQMEVALNAVRSLGLNPRLGRNTGKRRGYLAGTVQERLDDLHAMFRDPDVRGIWCVRGGYGAPQLLDQIDYSLVRANPKVFVGYSDITALHLAFRRFTGLITFHGPVLIFHGTASHFNTYTLANLKRVLFRNTPIGVLTLPQPSDAPAAEHRIQTIRSGIAHGPLIGGNLTLIAALMGTPYEIDTRRSVLFAEEVEEAPYRVDRMLTQLRLAGKLNAAAGILFGECTDCGTSDCKPAFESTLSVSEVLNNILGEARVPAVFGLPIGHTIDQLTLPVGLPATLDADRGELIIEESAVI